MNQTPYYFEIKDLVTQFIAAFDDVTIKRYNVNRQPQDTIAVRYLYSPKERVLYDIINTGANIVLPVIVVTIDNVSRDNDRVFNKLEGFIYSSEQGGSLNSAPLKSPVPINISVTMSIMTRYQTDMDQIISNFAAYSNPYVVISWKIPLALGLSDIQEIRSEVLWDGNVSLKYPITLTGKEKSLVTADTTFLIKGWLFKDQSEPVGNIYFAETNFYAESIFSDYSILSANTYTWPASTGLYTEIEKFQLSGTPTISNVFYNSVVLAGNLTLTRGSSGTIILQGYGLDTVEGILLSSTNLSIFNAITAVNINSISTISGAQLSAYTIINSNIISFTLPPIYNTGVLTVVPYNTAGYNTTAQAYMTAGKPVNTFIILT